MISLAQTEYWKIPFLDFVDSLRFYKDTSLIEIPIVNDHEKFDALLASTIEYLCNELRIKAPDWVWDIAACKEPWFVSGMENLKAIVLQNFLDRV